MKPEKLSHTFCIILCLGIFLGDSVFPSHAAEAASPPVAQKASVAKKPAPAKAPVKASTKVAPRPNANHLTSIASSAPKAPVGKQAAPAPELTLATAQPSENDAIKKSLDTFAKDCLVRMNKVTHKATQKLPNGTYMATYMEYDSNSLETSYSPVVNNKTIKYIGRMHYVEIEYTCTGKNAKEALAGPYTEANRTPVTELIKYKAGKWTY